MNSTSPIVSISPESAPVTVSIVVPCYNESAVFPLLVQRLRKLELPKRFELEFVLVDDGSADDTWIQINACCEASDQWVGVRLSRNFGHQAAVWSGLQAATGDVVFVLDADLQDPPELLLRFLEAWESGSPVVYGVRKKRKEPGWKKVSYSVFYRLLDSIADIDIPLDSGDFCLIDRRVVQTILESRDSQPFIRGLRAAAGFRQTPLEYERDARAAGAPKYGLSMLFNLAINGLFGFSRKPLRAILWSGIGLLMVGGLLLTLGLTSWFTGQLFTNSTVPSVMMAGLMVLLSGMHMTAMGILGEYIGRVYFNSQQRPIAVVEELRNGSASGFPRYSEPAKRKAA